jgi:hypothetical protein
VLEILAAIAGLVFLLTMVSWGLDKPIVAVVTFFIGFAPLIANVIANAVASWLGCFIHEGITYPCMVGSTDIGSLLHLMAIAGFFLAYTAPFALISIVLFAAYLVRWIRRHLTR